MSALSAFTSAVYGELPFRTTGFPVLMDRMTASKSLASVQYTFSPSVRSTSWIEITLFAW